MADTKFEVSMKRLEEIVNILENGKADLDESISLYEEGLALSSKLHEQLTSFEKKIDDLNKQEMKAEGEENE